MKAHTSFRLVDGEEDLKQLLESKGGLKPGVKWLYQYYLDHINIVDEIVSKLTSSGLSLGNTSTKPKTISLKDFNTDDDYSKNF